VYRIALSDGILEQVTAGARPRVSPDGANLAVMSSSSCLERPSLEDDSTELYAPTDQITIVDLQTGAESEHRLDVADPLAPDATLIHDIMWSSDGRLVYTTTDQRLVQVDLLGGESIDQPGTQLAVGAGPLDVVLLVGTTPDDRVLAELLYDDGTTFGSRVFELDLATGVGGTPISTYDEELAAVTMDADGRLLTVLFGEFLIDDEPVGLQAISEYGEGFATSATG
jgi:hypothetical protein